MVALSPDRTTAYYSHDQNVISALDVESGALKWELKIPPTRRPNTPESIARTPALLRLGVHPRGDLYVIDAVQSVVFIINPIGKIIRVEPFDPPTTLWFSRPNFQFTKDGAAIFASADSIYWMNADRITKKLFVSNDRYPIVDLELSYDNALIYVLKGAGPPSSVGIIDAYDVFTGRKIWSYRNSTYEFFNDIETDRSGNLFIAGVARHALDRWDLAGVKLPSIEDASSEVGGGLICLSSKGKTKWIAPIKGTYLLRSLVLDKKQNAIYLFGQTYVKDAFGNRSIVAIYALDYKGKTKWDTIKEGIDFGIGFSSSSIYAERQAVYVGGEGNEIYILDAKTGGIIRRHKISSESIPTGLEWMFMVRVEGANNDRLFVVAETPAQKGKATGKKLYAIRLIR